MSEPHAGCPHPSRALRRVIASNGATHVVERCEGCGANVRGAGVWVPHAELRVPLEDLPVLADYRPKEPQEGERQGDLFGG